MEKRRPFHGPRTNERIRIPEVRVVGPNGEMLGVMDTSKALQMAREGDLDLVEVNPKANPPVCKIMNFGKFKYEEAKKQREAKKRQTVVAIKEIKLRPKTDEHDMQVKVRHVRRFLEDGNKVKITCRFRGREITHPEAARRQLEAMIRATEDVGFVETDSHMEGRTMTLLLAPKAMQTRKGPVISKKPVLAKAASESA